jgi:glycyl-tRNA synthetase beta chain
LATADLLLEIGTEEVPAGYIDGALDKLSGGRQAWLSERGFEFDADVVQTFATPRRLAVRFGQVGLEQPQRTERRLGPAVKAAFDADGNPGPAALGFARSSGIDPSQLQRVETKKGERIAADVTVGGAALADLLVEELDLRALLQLGFPKTMRWIEGDDFRFARPIRWLVCLLDNDVIPLRVAGLAAGRTTRGHRTLAPGPVELASPADYESALAGVSVVADPALRRDQIHAAAVEAAGVAGGTLLEDEDLLHEVAYLLEYPTAIVGSFEVERVEQLPPEVIITAMRSHQRYFSIKDGSGRLLPRFLTFRDGGDHGLDDIRRGNERVLKARLADASFYWDEDRKLSSDQKLEKLDRVVWLEGFGSVKAKCGRIETLAVELAKALVVDVDEIRLRRAAKVCKTDLATEMIRDGKEFTRLQGVIGRFYAIEAGEDPAVADSIREHLYPRFAADRLPVGELGVLIALADRLDTIAGCIRAGFLPTGGQDPYALRRQVLAVLRILQEHDWHLELEVWIERALAPHPGTPAEKSESADQMAGLFRGRMETLLADLPADIVRGVLSVSTLEPVDNLRAARALGELRGSESFERLLEGAKRCRNILAKAELLDEAGLKGIDRGRTLRSTATGVWRAWQAEAANGDGHGFAVERFRDSAEVALHAEALQRVSGLARAANEQRHADVFRSLSELGPVIDRYFEDVLVNTEDPSLRDNRVMFLRELHYLFATFADLELIAPA